MAYFDNDPHDDDYDGRPGSEENSAAFDRKFNRDGFNEYTNLPEIDERQEIARFERREAEMRARGVRRELREAMKRVQYWPHAGRFIIPRQNTYAAHLVLVREGNSVDIQFDPKTYLYFDKIIAQKAQKPELFNPRHPDYQQYVTLRENLAVLRNDIMGMYMDDGSFDPGDEKYLPRLAQMAAEIGDALNADNNIKKSIFPSLDTHIANIEGEGAAYMYKHLTERQVNHTLLGKVWAFIRRLSGMPDNQWQLPPIATTAFSQQALNALPPPDELCNCSAHELRQRAAEQAEELRQIIDPTDEHAVRDITSLERREAIKHGKVIIDWLRNIKFTDKSLQDMVDTSRPGGENLDRDAMAMLTHAYRSVMESAIKTRPSLDEHVLIQESNRVADVVEHSLQIMAKLENPNSQAETMDIGSSAEPEGWAALSKEALSRLMERLKAGLEKAVAEMALEQQEVNLSQEAFAENQVEEALAMQHAYSAKRAVKQKGRTQAQKVNLALSMDDKAAGQGAYANDDEEAIRIARQKLKTGGTAQTGRSKLNSDEGTKSDKRKGTDEEISMEERAAQAAAMGQTKAVNNKGIKGVDNQLLKQLGKQIMSIQQQANVAASEIADFKGGGIGLGTGEKFTEKKDRTPKDKPRIG